MFSILRQSNVKTILNETGKDAQLVVQANLSINVENKENIWKFKKRSQLLVVLVELTLKKIYIDNMYACYRRLQYHHPHYCKRHYNQHQQQVVTCY